MTKAAVSKERVKDNLSDKSYYNALAFVTQHLIG